jgi:hypothetical protein
MVDGGFEEEMRDMLSYFKVCALRAWKQILAF